MTVEPVFDYLARMQVLQLHHRNVNTRSELALHLENWAGRAYRDYEYLYLGFHGEPEMLDIGGEMFGLDSLRAKLREACAGRVVFLAACGALDSSERSLTQFCKETGADAIIGYTEVVPHVDAAAFEMLAFNRLFRIDGA